MPIIQEFTCCKCEYHCKSNVCTPGGDACAQKKLWHAIHSSNGHVATVKCPSPRCTASITQCTLCDRNIDSIKHHAIKKNNRPKRSAESYIKMHVVKCHREEIEHAAGECENQMDTDSHSDHVHIDFDSSVMEKSEVDPDSDLNWCNRSTMSFGIEDNSSIDPGGCLVDVFDNEDQNMLYGNGEGSLCSSSASEDSEQPAYDNDRNLYADFDNEVHLYGEKIMEKEIESMKESLNNEMFHAMEFLSPYDNVELDPGIDREDDETAPFDERVMAKVLRDAVRGGYEYDDFEFFDTRPDHQKPLRKGSIVHRKSQNQLYFWQKYKQKCRDPADDTGGYAGLVHRANSTQREDGMGMAGKGESKLIFKLQDMLLNSTCTMREKLIDYQSDLFSYFDLGCNGRATPVRIPTTMEETRALITEGTHSTVKNFPIPTVFEVEGDNEHACVSLIEVIRLMAGHGAEFNFAYDGAAKKKEDRRNVEGLNGSLAAEEMLKNLEEKMKSANVKKEIREKTKKGWILMWSDAFLRCFIKQKENSVWIITATVCPPTNKMSSGFYTHVLAMGKSGSDHTKVINHYLREIKQLQTGFKCYMGATNTIEHVALDMIAWSADRPERQMLQGTRKEGTYGKVSGYAVNPDEVHLPSCPDCYWKLICENVYPEEMTDGVHSEEICRKCQNWSFEPVESQIHLNDTVGKDYPRSNPDDSSDLESEPEGRESGRKKLGAVKLSSTWMTKVVTHAYKRVFKKRWTKATTKDFLRRCNVGGKQAETVFSRAEDDRIEDDFNPLSVQHGVWDLVDDCFGSYKFPDVPMHGIFHGMVPDVMYIVQQIFSHHNKYQLFVRYSNTILDDCASLRLEFLKLKSLPKAAWVGENCMSYMRIMSYLVGSFLRNHKLSQHEDETSEIVTNLKCMLNAFQSLVSVLMTRRKLDRKTIDNHVKIFLSSAHYLHEKYGKLNRKTRQVENNDEAQSGKKKKILGTLHFTQLREMLSEFSANIESLNKSELLKKLNEVKKASLKAKLTEWQQPDLGDKDTLYRKIAEHLNVLRREAHDVDEMDASTADGNSECGSQEDRPTTKRENRCWNKGNWLSFLANIAGQIEYLGPLQDIWEGRNERMIEGPKQVLVSMRKTQSYRLTKMKLLHKLMGVEWLGLAFRSAGIDRDWFKGYHIYNSQEEVLDRFSSGRPLSCFVKEPGSAIVHVAYSDDSLYGVCVVSFEYKTTSYFKQDMGVHFCEFTTVKDENRDLVIEKFDNKKDLADDIETYAIMLPYQFDKRKFICQYTLIYHDWDVLLCNRHDGVSKGIPSLQQSLFCQEYIQQIRR